MKLLIAIGTSYHISNPSCYFFEDQTMKRKWLAGIVFFLSIGAISTLAQFPSFRQRIEGTWATVSTPRFNQQNFFVEAGIAKNLPFLVEAGLDTYVTFTSKSMINIKVLNSANEEIEANASTFNVTESTANGLFIKKIRFTLDSSSTSREMWSVEMTSTEHTAVSLTTGNERGSDTGINITFEHLQPELNEPNRVFVFAPNFDASKQKIEIRTFETVSTPGDVVLLRDDGVAPDQTANDRTFTGDAPTNKLDSPFMIAKLMQKTATGVYVPVQTEMGSYSVYANSMHVIDAPQFKILNHAQYGVPVAIQADFDIEVITPGEYHIVTAITGNDKKSIASENRDTSNKIPFYSAGRHQVRIVHDLDPNDVEWLQGSSRFEYQVTDTANNRGIEHFTSQTPVAFPSNQLIRKRFQSFDGDRLVDTNGDGDSDALEVKFSAYVYEPGVYLWGAFLELSENAQVSSSYRGISTTRDESGPLTVGLHHFVVNIPLEDFWSTQAKGTFDITPTLVVTDSGQSVEVLNTPDLVFKSQYYDLTLGQAEPPKTIASLIQIIRDAKTLRPAEGVKAELISKAEEAQSNGVANKAPEARIALHEFFQVLDRVSKYFPEQKFRQIQSIAERVFSDYQNGIFK
jgi:hypothetical protein